jgi:hypothetical protein
MEILKTLKEKILGTPEQNQAAKERMRKMDEKNPDSTQAKVNKALGMKKGGKVKKFNDGGMSLEEKYPGAKITRAGPQPKPVEQPPKTILQEALREAKEAEYKNMSKKAELAPYERKAEKFEKTGGSGGGGGGVPKLNRDLTKNMKSGGKVSSASKRADGCAVRGKTRA